MAAEGNPQDRGSRASPLDDPILLGEAILDRAREVARWITQRVDDLTHRAWPDPRATDASTPRAGPDDTPAAGTPRESTRRLVERTRQTTEATARLLDEFHSLLAESWELISRSRASLANSAESRAASQCAGLVPEFSRSQPATTPPAVASSDLPTADPAPTDAAGR